MRSQHTGIAIIRGTTKDDVLAVEVEHMVLEKGW
jgi:hypothetical protein